MTRFLLTLLLTLSCVTGSAQTLTYATPMGKTEANTLNVKNAMLAAFALDKDADPIERAKAYLQVLELQRYASNMHDEAALLAESRIKAEEIAEELRKVDRKMLYVLEIQALAVAVKDRAVTLRTEFNTGMYSFPTDFGASNDYFPPLYEFLIANAEAFQHFEVSQGRAAEYARIIGDQGPQVAYVRAEFELVSLQQHRRFQTIIRRISWYSDYARTKLISEVVDKRSSHSVIKDRMLSEGATYEVVPEHAFLIAGERLLETIPATALRERNCKETERERGHRVFECNDPYEFIFKLKVDAHYRYVGGRLVQVRLRLPAGTQVTADQVDQSWQLVRREHTAPPLPGPDVTKWKYGAGRFEFDIEALRKADSSKDFYVCTAIPYDDLKAGKEGTGVTH